MRLFKSRNDLDDDLTGLQSELITAEKKLVDVRDRESAAIDTPTAFAAWRAERDAAIAEVERLNRLIEHREAAATEQKQRDEQAALAKKVETQRRANEALAQRIREEGGPAITTLLNLARDVAAAAVVDAQLNARLPDDADKVVGADHLARYRVPKAEEVLSEKETELWVFAANGNVVGAQGDVIEHPNGVGELPYATFEAQCVKRAFRQVEYLEAEPRQPFEPFYALRLIDVDGPGMAWNPRPDVSPSAVLAALDRRSVPAERTVLTRLVPLKPWPKPEAPRVSWNRSGDI